MTPPTEHAGSSHLQGPPSHPLPQGTARGSALAVAALALDTLTGRKMRLLWCVDLGRDAGPHWPQLLERFKGALDRLPWGPAGCRLAMVTRDLVGHAEPEGCELCRHDSEVQLFGKPCPGCGSNVVLTYAIPYLVDLGALCRAAPPVGVWRLMVDPNPEGKAMPRDNLPPDYFMSGIPF